VITEALLSRHRGPFILVAFRPKKVTRFGRPEMTEEKEVIATGVSKEDVLELADSFLSDPRDSIVAIHVWSERENQFLGGVRKEWLEKTKAA
jgi:hypothetical protein